MLLDSGSPGVTVSEGGSRFSFDLVPALRIPLDAKDVSLSVVSATIWWTVPNFVTGVNDSFHITGPDTLDVVTPYVITIPQGLYSLAQLEEALLLGLAAAGAKISPLPLVNLLADNSTGRIIVKLNYVTASMNFPALSPYQRLGFNLNDTLLGTTLANGLPLGYNLAVRTADFNPVDSFLVHSSLVDTGLRVNNAFSNVIAQVLINNAPGSQILYEPRVPSVVDASILRGNTGFANMWLTNSTNQPVDTNGESWSVRVVIRYN